jgi:hypothetical protein
VTGLSKLATRNSQLLTPISAAIVSVASVAISVKMSIAVKSVSNYYYTLRRAVSNSDDDSDRSMNQRAENAAQGPVSCRCDSCYRHEPNAQRANGDLSDCIFLHFNFSFLISRPLPVVVDVETKKPGRSSPVLAEKTHRRESGETLELPV